MADAPPKRPPGRPRLDPDDTSASVSLSLRVSAKQYDKLYGAASKQRVSLCDWVRAAITAEIKRARSS